MPRRDVVKRVRPLIEFLIGWGTFGGDPRGEQSLDEVDYAGGEGLEGVQGLHNTRHNI